MVEGDPGSFLSFIRGQYDVSSRSNFDDAESFMS